MRVISGKADIHRPRLCGFDHLITIAALLLVVIALWAPFGLRVGPTFEEWKALYWSEERGGVPVLFRNRPLVFAPYAVAHLITPEPLLALNLMQAGFMLGKGALVYLLVFRLVPAGAALGFLAGVLSIVYPADTGLFTLRKVMLHLAVFFDLVAVHLLLSLWQKFRWWLVGAIWVAQSLSLASDIPSIPFLLASPVLLVWKERRLSRRLGRISLARRFSRRLGRIWLAWSVVPAFFFALNVAYAFRASSYEAEVLATSGLGPGALATVLQILDRTVRAYARHFAGGWTEAATRLGPPWGDTGLAIATAVLVVSPALWWHAGRHTAPRSLRGARPFVDLALLGLAAMPVGFLLFLPTRWMATNWRVFFHSSIAAALVVAVLCWLLAATCRRGRRPVFLLLGAGLTTLAVATSLAQHRAYFETSLGQQRLLAGIMREAPRLQPGTLVLLLDTPPYIGRRHWRICALVSECLWMSLRYAYARRDVDALFCSPGYRPRGVRSEECRFERDELVVSYRNPWGQEQITHRYPYDRIVAFESSDNGVRLMPDLLSYRTDGGPPTYAPHALIDRSAELPPRVRTMFTRWPL